MDTGDTMASSSGQNDTQTDGTPTFSALEDTQNTLPTQGPELPSKDAQNPSVKYIAKFYGRRMLEMINCSRTGCHRRARHGVEWCWTFASTMFRENICDRHMDILSRYGARVLNRYCPYKGA